MSQIKEKSVLVCECVLRGESGCQGATVLVKRDARVSESWGREWGESGERVGRLVVTPVTPAADRSRSQWVIHQSRGRVTSSSSSGPGTQRQQSATNVECLQITLAMSHVNPVASSKPISVPEIDYRDFQHSPLSQSTSTFAHPMFHSVSKQNQIINPR